jgi:hypothetical protein
MDKDLNAKERLKIILKPILTSKDIMKLEGCKQRWANELLLRWRPADTKLIKGQIKSSDYLKAKGISLEDYIERAVAELQLEIAGIID